MVVLAGSSGSGAGMLVARVERVCMQQGQSKQLAHLQTTRQGSEKGPRLREMLPTTTTALNQQIFKSWATAWGEKGSRAITGTWGIQSQHKSSSSEKHNVILKNLCIMRPDHQKKPQSEQHMTPHGKMLIPHNRLKHKKQPCNFWRVSDRHEKGLFSIGSLDEKKKKNKATLPVLFQLGFSWRHVFQAAGAVVRVHLKKTQSHHTRYLAHLCPDSPKLPHNPTRIRVWQQQGEAREGLMDFLVCKTLAHLSQILIFNNTNYKVS